MARNILKIIKVLDKRTGALFGTNSGSWFPVGTVLPDPPVESDMHRLSVQLFNCTCNTWTVKNMLKQGLLAPTESDSVFKLTPYAKTLVREKNERQTQ